MNICHNDLLYKRCKAVTQLFNHCQKSIDSFATPILSKKQYNMNNIQQIHGYFNKMINTNSNNLRTTLHKLKENAEEERVNPWFKKAATIFSLNTKINIQKSFWRLKFHMDSSGLHYNPTTIVKLKKLYNNIRKQYELNLFRAFLMIDKYGRTERSRSKAAKAPEPPRPATQPAPAAQPAAAPQENNAQLEAVLANSKKASLSIIDRVFRRNFSRQIKKWQFNAYPEKKL